ncbi:Multiple coagulation factor deficiency protein 2-like protein [Armadillidium nasatum]|uniref:Multiple coagulation factor deficiency protein 2-like protein n=1 Tax=Armadillidium nasatum TaxID=96803 RepID=A0A5N5SZI4_9CRUS|nr:Multiple coagulation factor deficiency protein 2-like protein [Armadillidium nasatum]
MKEIITILFISGLLSFVSTTVSHGPGSHSHMKHKHHHPELKKGNRKSVLENDEVVQDKEHLKEEAPSLHLTKEQIENMTSEEVEFHYFTIHDLDKDNNLDGLELMQAIMHIATGPDTPLEGLSDYEREEALKERRIKFESKMVDVTLSLFSPQEK